MVIIAFPFCRYLILRSGILHTVNQKTALDFSLQFVSKSLLTHVDMRETSGNEEIRIEDYLRQLTAVREKKGTYRTSKKKETNHHVGSRVIVLSILNIAPQID